MTDKELTKRAISSTFYVVLVFFLLMGISFAWFSHNHAVTASGMAVEVQTSANLVISDTENFNGLQFVVSMPSDVRKLLPASHSTTSSSGLQKPADLTEIDYYSGLSSQTDIAMEPVPEDQDNHSLYYKDYIVYISCRGAALDHATLTAEMEAPEPDISRKPYLQAASIDFYLGSVAAANYRGTRNLARLDMDKNHGAYDPTKTMVELSIVDNGRIPCLQDTATDPNYLKIIMRCYFDGALQNTLDTTFVTSAALDTTEFKMRVTFTASGTEAEPN